MSSMQGSTGTAPLAKKLPLAHLFRGPASLRALIIALMVSLAGCATSARAPSPAPVVIPESTWRQIDSDIVAVSRNAKQQATNHARAAMKDWRILVYQRTDADFIPWFSSYWTRRWLTVKVSWYKLSAGGEKDPTVERLAIYLQAEYRDRVLEPVAREVDPDRIMEQTTKLYVWLLGELLPRIPARYGVPADQFERRLKAIPAIALAPPPSHGASLHAIVHADPIGKLPAYAALVERIRHAPGGTQAWSADTGISSVAKQTSQTLVTELATGSVASVVSAVVGSAAGLVISLGTAGFNAMLRANERPRMEAQLRRSLHAAFDEEWRELMHDPDRGVLAGFHHLSGQIEGSLANDDDEAPQD